MSTMKKLTALLICLVIMCGFAVSCTPDDPGTGDVGENGGNGNQNGGGDEELNFPTDKYVATVIVAFESDDLKMQDAIATMGDATYTVTADGTGLMIESSADIGSISLDEAYTYLGGTLYHSTTLTSGDKSASSLEKAAMSDSDRDALLDKIGPGASIGKNDFLQFDMSKEGNYKTYICSKIKTESAESLCKVFEAKLDGTATVKLDSVDYTLVLLGDANDSFTLSCSFTVTMDGADYSVTMNMSCNYEYKDVSVSAPDNADKYSDAALSEIIG